MKGCPCCYCRRRRREVWRDVIGIGIVVGYIVLLVIIVGAFQ